MSKCVFSNQLDLIQNGEKLCTCDSLNTACGDSNGRAILDSTRCSFMGVAGSYQVNVTFPRSADATSGIYVLAVKCTTVQTPTPLTPTPLTPTPLTPTPLTPTPLTPTPLTP
eukprot:PhF_6_TR37870/c0_g1_i1/m.56461